MDRPLRGRDGGPGDVLLPRRFRLHDEPAVFYDVPAGSASGRARAAPLGSRRRRDSGLRGPQGDEISRHGHKR